MNFKVIEHPEVTGSSSLLQCQCGTIFVADACGEENLVWDGETLLAQCPKCHEVEEKI